ncbi:MAG TPA: NAD-dependent epimerase [Spirochaetota bacterium]|jgi:UDP-glucuronate 4-epimerase|nr:NAD-dependent epimerase [Spirochaetota bacterium]HOK02376.1 NAD-dependent epimerase [Spirochaetota bacterium]HOK92802.1 NAD-dependent epimerase [Spirochaetota bacterium]HOQ13259.1 NAD-dependent epimerase [Spirochaetota bacterium]HOV09586.1 NAD-dependent epimerase [Spirochaetota bacterium]
MKILVTGTAGFIGSFVAKKLAQRGDIVFGIDSINDYYDVSLKYSRLSDSGFDRADVDSGKVVKSSLYPDYRFCKISLEDQLSIKSLFEQEKFDMVCHLAAQAGVRYSLTNPYAYMDSNIIGFMNILENCRHNGIKHLVFASSSSVYGLNEKMPFATTDNVDHPVSLYAATKKSNELMAHAYSHLFGIPVTGLRFFTVYGPWGRPDMAYFKFTKAIAEGKSIDVYNNGDMLRDFTYIDDIVEGVIRTIDLIPKGNPAWSGLNPDPGSSKAPYKIYNIGNNNPVKLLDFINIIEKEMGKVAQKNFLPMQPGDVYATYADVDDLAADTGYRPYTPVEEGIAKFVKWYRDYYKV